MNLEELQIQKALSDIIFLPWRTVRVSGVVGGVLTKKYTRNVIPTSHMSPSGRMIINFDRGSFCLLIRHARAPSKPAAVPGVCQWDSTWVSFCCARPNTIVNLPLFIIPIDIRSSSDRNHDHLIR